MTVQQVFKATLVIMLMLAGAYVLLMGLRIIIVLIVAIIIASAVRPYVNRLMRLRFPEGAAIVTVYLILALVIMVMFVAVFPPVVNQIAFYIENDSWLAFRIIRAQQWVERTIHDVTQSEVSLVSPDEIRTAVSEFVGELRDVMPSMLDDIGNTLGEAVLIFVMGAYWLTSYRKATDFVTQLSAPLQREKVQRVLTEIESVSGSYVRGVVTVATIIGFLNFLFMQLLGVPNAVTLGFIIGVTTTIPMIGGLIGGIISLFLTLVVEPEALPAAFAVFIVLQQFENYILTPRVMSSNIGLDPLLIIVYTAIGFVMFGIVGALISVPVMATIHILIVEFVLEPHKENLKTIHQEILLVPSDFKMKDNGIKETLDGVQK